STSRFYNTATNRWVGKIVLSLLASDHKVDSGITGQTIDVPATHPNNPVLIRVDVTGMTQVGRSTADLRTFGKTIATLVAFKTLDTFSVGVEPGQEKTSFNLQLDHGVLIPIRNDDPSAYRVTWTLKASELPSSLSGEATLDPAKTTWIEVKPTSSPSDMEFLDGVGLAGLLKPLATKGTLEIKPAPGSLEQADSSKAPDANIGRSVLLPLVVTVNDYSDVARLFWSTAFVLFFLTAGGVSSLVVSTIAPNASKLVDATELLGSTLAERIRGLHVHVGQRLGVMLRVERHRLQAVLKSRRLFSPDFATVLAQVNAGAATMMRQLDLLEQADHIYDRISAMPFGAAPPTIVLQIEQIFDQITDRLATAAPQEGDFTAAAALIANANNKLDGISNLDVNFVTPLVERAHRLRNDFALDVSPPTPWLHIADKCAAVHFLLDILHSPFDDPKTIDADRYAFFDVNLNRLLIMSEFLPIYARDLNVAQKRAILLRKLDDLVNNLSSETWESFRRARLLLREMSQGKYREDIVQKISDPANLVVLIDPDFMIVEQPSTFEVQFADALYNELEARAEITPRWDFGDGRTEIGWKVIHFYNRQFLEGSPSDSTGTNAAQRTAEVSVTFEVDGKPLTVVPGGTPVTAIPHKPLVVHSNPNAMYFGVRTRTEFFRLAIALAAVVAGYLVTAQGKIAAVDVLTAMVVTFAAGFGINNLKDIVAPQK
ncbi:MAG TPA: hypothetical protein VFC46_11565, partial [Humisphaera sp.]|nr:hypothetical protein [Humisphaera sp.]